MNNDDFSQFLIWFAVAVSVLIFSVVMIFVVVPFGVGYLVTPPISRAAASGNVEELSRLIEEADPEEIDRDNLGLTPLQAASRLGRLESVRLLVEEGGANVNAYDYRGYKSADLAILGRHWETVDYLREREWLIRRTKIFGDSPPNLLWEDPRYEDLFRENVITPTAPTP